MSKISEVINSSCKTTNNDTKYTATSDMLKCSTADKVSNDNETDYKLKYIFALTELENFKKLSEKHKFTAIKHNKKNILLNVLKVLDSLLSFKGLAKGKLDNVLVVALDLIIKQVISMLENEGCKKIECNVGEAFDPNYHEAIESISSEKPQTFPTVASVFQTGWTLDDNQLLRPTRVSVKN